MPEKPAIDKPASCSKEKCTLEEIDPEELEEMLERFDFLRSYRPCCSF
ncbi:MAG: hypothetical protein ACFFCS_21315 [Candidatus Hodarchaeota archaeon]